MHVHRAIVQAIQKDDPGVTLTPSVGKPNIRTSSGKAYFSKVGFPDDTEQYVGEAESLKAMHIAAPGLAPRVLACATIDADTKELPNDVGRPYFVSEYKNLGSLTDASASVLGRRLASELHEYKSTHGFGFHVPTYCGATRLENGWYETWEQCFDALIGGLLATLEKRGGLYSGLCKKGHQVRNSAIPALLRDLVVEPVLIHGDLWSGNVGTDSTTGQPIIFDPSSYFGHNEADLAIARIFGGFPMSFITTYHEHKPKTEPADQYELRGVLYELFHYLNHTVLFGGSYARSSEKKMDELLKAFPEE